MEVFQIELRTVNEKLIESNTITELIIKQNLHQFIKKQNELFINQINIIENKDLTQEDLLLLNPNDFKATIYDSDPDWTHYYYKGQRILSLGPVKLKDIKDDDGAYICNIIQQYY